MKIKIDKLSTSTIRVFIKSIDTIMETGTITLRLSISKKEDSFVVELPYERTKIVYDFDLSKEAPKNPGDFKYLVTVSDGNTDETSRPTIVGSGAPHHISGAVKKIQHDFRRVAKQYNGSVIYMFKKIPTGGNCTDCWDEDLMGSNNSNCKTCGGTGKVTYYSQPFKSYGDAVKFTNEKYGTQDSGKVMENTAVQMSAVADFVLTTDDMVYYDNTGDWYRVKARTVSELQSFPVLQMLIMDLMPSGAPETETAYKLIHKDEL